MNQAQRLEDGTITAQCGMTMARLATIAMEHGYTGLEFAHGIPGTVGGGVYMNAGAYGGEMQQVVTNVTAMDRKGHVLELPAEELRLSYRHSRLMEEDLVILSATVRLQKESGKRFVQNGGAYDPAQNLAAAGIPLGGAVPSNALWGAMQLR